MMRSITIFSLLPYLTLLLLLLLLLRLPWAQGQSGENFSQVLHNIFKIDNRVRPVRNYANITEVTVSFHLMSIIVFDTVEQKLVSNGWMRVEWMNEYTVWNPWESGHVYFVSPDPDKVWRPMLTVQNTMKDLMPIGEKYITMILDFNGTTTWYPAERFETFCKVDVTYFPFDIQKCQWTFFVWGGDSDHVHLKPMTDTIDLDTFVINGEWDLRETRAWVDIEIMDGVQFTNLKYEVTIRRRPSLLALTVLLPVMVVAVVNVCVFTIPSESGERLAYSMTALLSFGVFMSFIMDSMPSSTESLSIVAVNMSTLLVLSALYVMLCILSLRLFHRDSSKHPVPATLQSIIVWLELLVCLDPPAKNKVMDIYQIATPLITATDLTEPGSGKEGGGVGVDKGAKESKLKGQLDKWARTRRKDHAAYTDPTEMTWRRVSRTLDKLLFRFFFSLVFVSSVGVWSILVINYCG